MTRDEIKATMAIVAAVHQHWQVNSTLVDLWHKILGKYEKQIVNAAVEKYLAEPHDFPPKPGQINATCEKLAAPDLFDNAAEAADSDSTLAVYARTAADRLHPWDSRQQYRSPEDLAEAKRIQQARWQRAYKEIYESKKSEVLDYMRMGKSKDQAIERALWLVPTDTKQITSGERVALALVKGAAR